jgi:hypothetical protein
MAGQPQIRSLAVRVLADVSDFGGMKEAGHL